MSQVQRGGAPCKTENAEGGVADEVRQDVGAEETRRGARNCFSCRFWCPTDAASGRGERMGYCKRRAPQIVAGDNDHRGVPRTFTQWPRTPADQWCGEFAADEGRS